MKVVKMSKVAKVPRDMVGGLMTGTQVYGQAILQPGDSNNFTLAAVHFSAGSRNKFHKHTSDQILIITEGIGKVATDHQVVTVRKGDVVVIPAGENHWHGAPGKTAMAHINIAGKGSQTTQTER